MMKLGIFYFTLLYTAVLIGGGGVNYCDTEKCGNENVRFEIRYTKRLRYNWAREILSLDVYV